MSNAHAQSKEHTQHVGLDLGGDGGAGGSRRLQKKQDEFLEECVSISPAMQKPGALDALKMLFLDDECSKAARSL